MNTLPEHFINYLVYNTFVIVCVVIIGIGLIFTLSLISIKIACYIVKNIREILNIWAVIW
jgi:hypothetical protein